MIDVAPRPVTPEDLEAYEDDPAVQAVRQAAERPELPPKREARICPCRGLTEQELFEAHGLDHRAGAR